MKTLDQTFATVNKYNAGIFKNLRGDFNTLIELNSTPVEENQKWADVSCNAEEFAIEDYQNLSDDEISKITQLLQYLQNQFQKDEDFAKMITATERSLMYEN